MSYIKAWKTKSGKINYKAIGDNGKVLFPSGNQQFNRKEGLITNLRAIGKMFNSSGKEIMVRWTKSARSKSVLKEEMIWVRNI